MWPGEPIPKTLDAIHKLRAAHVEFYKFFALAWGVAIGLFLLSQLFDLNNRFSSFAEITIVDGLFLIASLVPAYCIIRCVHIGFTSFVCPNCGATPREESSGYGAGISFNPKRCVRCDYPLSVDEMQKDLTLEKQEAEGRARVLAARADRELLP